MEKKVVTKGLFLKNRISYDSNSIEFDHEFIQFPLSFFPFKWIGFIGHENKEYEFNEKIHYFMNVGKILNRKTLYLSISSKYDSLPTSDSEISTDDKDDFTMQQLNDRTDQDESAALVEAGLIKPIKIIEDSDYDADLYLKTETIQLRFENKILEELYTILEGSKAHQMQTAKAGSVFSLSQQILAYDDQWAFHVSPKPLGFDADIDSTPIKYMAFFLKQHALFGRSKLYCGYHRQLNIKSISSKNVDQFYSWCKERAPRLNSEGKTFKSSVLGNPFNLWRWLYPDNISITDEAIIYTRKTLQRDEMVYLPFQRINIFLSTKGLFFKKFEIYGEQNVTPKFSFTSTDIAELERLVNKKGIKSSIGRSWHSSYLFPKNWFGRAPRLLYVDGKWIFFPKRLKSELKKYYGMKEHVSFLQDNEVCISCWYKKRFPWFGTIAITGVHFSIREDQDKRFVYMIVPNLSMFSYKYFLLFSGSLRRQLKYSNITRIRKYKKYNFEHDFGILRDRTEKEMNNIER